LFQGVSRFDALQERLGIARNVLATRLRHLVAEGILEKVSYQDRPLRHQYQLTQKGRDLFPVLVALMGWGDRWLAQGAAPPLTLVHRGCGRAVAPTVTCPHCSEPLDPGNTRARLSAGLLARSP
jgi:DNA-binding HxlR family transcriptional regulator